MITAEVIKHSIYNGVELVTFELEYPRYIHAEVLTHRAFSRNSSSSRAIPVDRMIKEVSGRDWYPIFMENKRGMAASTPLTEGDLDEACYQWDIAKRDAIFHANRFMQKGVHKQIANRLLEPFSLIKTIVSATDLDNFFKLRLAEGAQQEIQMLANCMKESLNQSKPKQLDVASWHLPYIREDEEVLPVPTQIALSTARCARVSYLNHNGIKSLEDDVKLHDTLIAEKHMSPTEHQATPAINGEYYGNFRGWIQYRKYLDNGWKWKQLETK